MKFTLPLFITIILASLKPWFVSSRTIIKFVPLVFIVLLLASCFSEGDCLISATNKLHIQFKKKSNHALDTTIAFTGISVSGSDSIVVFKSLVKEILIPADIHNTFTKLIFHRINTADSSVTATDTLQVSYTKQTKVITRDCGAYTFYQNLKIIQTNLQSKIISTSLLKDPTGSGPSAYAVNFQIYY